MTSVRISPAHYVHFGAAVSCLTERVRLIPADVRGIIDVIAWPVPLPFQGMVFEHLVLALTDHS